ncbi:glutathione-disulfide reductase [Noviherbaspirillum galbum]|uniref:Glutathione-disulfide reductase n=1 Tax=Noviherbaspirillum galbum TaxID=2709383 RepID=A0A6B3SUQ4_9BURK|nr:glutathione-disulfide reductase [Noviherbaspirillum galbum]NEX64760.1 glutathione-disulfide reductase [Noviherbaspirillum galbum]
MSESYDLIAIGGGSGGVAAARRAAAHGARVAIIEQANLGGTCVHRGCIPKKLLMYASQFRASFDLAAAYGWSAGQPEFSMAHWQDAKTRELERLETVYENMLRQADVTVIRGTATIMGAGEVRVGDRTMACKNLLIATGGRPSTAPIPGLDTALTSDDILQLRTVPERLAVVGGGYIGMEFASMFARLGSKVSVFFRANAPLSGFDEELRERLRQAMEHAGIAVFPQTLPRSLARDGSGYRMVLQDGQEMRFDAVLNATGRVPNTAGLGLDAIGLELTAAGAIPVDSYSKTRIPGVHAIGDVTNRVNLTPVAIAEGRAFADTVFGGQDTPFFHDQVATAVFTDPPIGTIGLGETQANARGPTTVYETQFKPMQTAFAGRDNRSYMKLVTDSETAKVIGIHMIGPDAPEIIQSLAVAMRAGATKREFDRTIAVHPTAAEEFMLMREPVRTYAAAT